MKSIIHQMQYLFLSFCQARKRQVSSSNLHQQHQYAYMDRFVKLIKALVMLSFLNIFSIFIFSSTHQKTSTSARFASNLVPEPNGHSVESTVMKQINPDQMKMVQENDNEFNKKSLEIQYQQPASTVTEHHQQNIISDNKLDVELLASDLLGLRNDTFCDIIASTEDVITLKKYLRTVISFLQNPTSKTKDPYHSVFGFVSFKPSRVGPDFSELPPIELQNLRETRFPVVTIKNLLPSPPNRSYIEADFLFHAFNPARGNKNTNEENIRIANDLLRKISSVSYPVLRKRGVRVNQDTTKFSHYVNECDCKFHHRVICLGHFKTGTTSMVDALKVLGYPHGKFTRSFLSGIVDRNAQFLPSTLQYEFFAALEGRRGSIPQHQAEHVYDLDISHAAGDSPYLFLYPWFDKLYPRSKYILTKRGSTLEVVVSELKQLSRLWLFATPKATLLELVMKYPPPSIEIAIRNIAQYGWVQHALLVARRYETHNRMVKDYFAKHGKDRLLEIVLSDTKNPWKDIAKFLNCSKYPAFDFPFTNAAKDSKRPGVADIVIDESIKRLVREWHLYDYEWYRISSQEKTPRWPKTSTTDDSWAKKSSNFTKSNVVWRWRVTRDGIPAHDYFLLQNNITNPEDYRIFDFEGVKGSKLPYEI